MVHLPAGGHHEAVLIRMMRAVFLCPPAERTIVKIALDILKQGVFGAFHILCLDRDSVVDAPAEYSFLVKVVTPDSIPQEVQEIGSVLRVQQYCKTRIKYIDIGDLKRNRHSLNPPP